MEREKSSINKSTVTGLALKLLEELTGKNVMTKETLDIYHELVYTPTADSFISIMEKNLRPGETRLLKNGLLSVNKLGGFDENGIPYLYLVTLAYLCNPVVPRREKIKLLKEKVQDENTRAFLRNFCSLGMGSQYLSRAFSRDHEPELKAMIELISAVVNDSEQRI